MKKITFLVIALISSVMLYAQQYPVSAAKGNATPGGTRDNEFQCLPNSVFSQIYPTYNNNYFCDNTYGLTMVADDYVATGPF